MCKYLGRQNGVTVSVVSTSVLGGANAVPTGGICTNTGAAHNIGISGILAANAADVDDAEDSDGEISKIDFRGVNLRSKKKREVSNSQNGDKIGDGDANGDSGACCDDNSQHQPERPMSWEGELSDQEMSSNTITNQVKLVRWHRKDDEIHLICPIVKEIIEVETISHILNVFQLKLSTSGS